MTVSGSKSSSMVDRRHINNRSAKRRSSRSRGMLKGRSGDSSKSSVNKIISKATLQQYGVRKK